MRGPLIALAAAVGGALLVPAVPLAEDPPKPPTAVLESATATVEAGTPVKLDSSKSSAGDAPIAGHVWDLDGNGSFETDTGAEPTVEATPEDAGPLTVQVRVVDASGQNGDAKLDLTVTAPKEIEAPEPQAAEPQAEAEPDTDKAPSRSNPSVQQLDPPGDPKPADPQPEPQADEPDEGRSAPAVPALTPLRMSRAPALVAQAKLKTVTAKSTQVKAAASSGVTIRNFAFAPASISVSVGDTVTWTNQDVAPHNARANDGSFRTPNLNKGGSGSVTFSKAGTFAYICTIHPSMKGTVTVAGASGGDTSGGDDTGSSAGSDDTAADDTSGGLPQTGLNLIAVVLLAALMLGSGALLNRRLARVG